MKLLLDESVPWRLAASFPKSFKVQTVQEMGGAGTENGRLLLLAATEQFDALVTVDQGIEHQKNVRDLPIPVVIMRAARNRFQELQPLVPRVVSILSRDLQSGIYRVSA
jgi:predicted nuclease of predicted toxin-antitoxin system